MATQSTFDRLRARAEADRTGIYILFGPDPDNSLAMRAYIGEADCVRDRINQSAGQRGFWETAVIVTTSDEALTKGHVRYLEARLLQMVREAGRVTLDNTQNPDAERRRLPEADKANMEAFLANIRVILPVIGVDLLKPRPKAGTAPPQPDGGTDLRFELPHKSGVKAIAVEEDGEFTVLEGSQARKDANLPGAKSYAKLRNDLIGQGVLSTSEGEDFYRFIRSYVFKSPSAAAAVILDRAANGRREWKVVQSGLSYHEWQEQKSKAEAQAESGLAD